MPFTLDHIDAKVTEQSIALEVKGTLTGESNTIRFEMQVHYVDHVGAVVHQSVGYEVGAFHFSVSLPVTEPKTVQRVEVSAMLGRNVVTSGSFAPPVLLLRDLSIVEETNTQVTFDLENAKVIIDGVEQPRVRSTEVNWTLDVNGQILRMSRNYTAGTLTETFPFGEAIQSVDLLGTAEGWSEIAMSDAA